jgi:hypothetical protein
MNEGNNLEDFEAGDLVGISEPDSARGIILNVRVGPPESHQLIELAAETGQSSLELARTLIHEALALRLKAVKR